MASNIAYRDVNHLQETLQVCFQSCMEVIPMEEAEFPQF